MPKHFQIGQLSELLKVSVETIRYYEREGLLPKPERSVGNFRLYPEQTRKRLEFILNCRALDMTLDEVRELLRLRDLPQQGCLEVNQLLDTHIGHVGERIRALRHLEKELKAVRSRCGGDGASAECGILNVLGDGRPDRARPRQAAKPSDRRGH